jgi:hypothetical protein
MEAMLMIVPPRPAQSSALPLRATSRNSQSRWFRERCVAGKVEEVFDVHGASRVVGSAYYTGRSVLDIVVQRGACRVHADGEYAPENRSTVRREPSRQSDGVLPGSAGARCHSTSCHLRGGGTRVHRLSACRRSRFSRPGCRYRRRRVEYSRYYQIPRSADDLLI